jgi:hypothetical protein
MTATRGDIMRSMSFLTSSLHGCLKVGSAVCLVALAGCAVDVDGNDRGEESRSNDPQAAAGSEQVGNAAEALVTHHRAVCGRQTTGIVCATSTIASFGTQTVWQSVFSDVNTWNLAKYYSTIQFADLDGDGNDDVCGRGPGGMTCALSTGARFGAATVWQSLFSDANGFGNGPEFYSTIKLADINGDGKADVCGRGISGVYCALSTGTTFGAATLWNSTFTDANTWNLAKYYSTIQFADINGDGKADLCGRFSSGMLCALSTGTTFAAPTNWIVGYSDAAAWGNGPYYYSTIKLVDMNKDGKADICGRGIGGVVCNYSTGTAFGAGGLSAPLFSDVNGWNTDPKYYSTIQYADVNGDGNVDVCGRGVGGMSCALSTGPAGNFAAATTWSLSFSDPAQFGNPQYYTSIGLVDINLDGKADICARGIGGIVCELSTGTAFGPGGFGEFSFSNVNGWNLGPEYYSTIRYPVEL